MLNIFEYIFNLISFFMRLLLNWVTSPLLKILEDLIPDIQDYFNSATYFISTYFFKGFQFIKMILIHLTGLNHNVWILACSTLLISISIFGAITLIKFGLNVWSLVHGNQKGG